MLYLAPPGRHPGVLSRYSFLEEEIRALSEAGVEAFVFSTVDTRNSDDGRLHIRVLPGDSRSERVKTIGFLSRHLRRVPFANLGDIRQCYRSMRVERFAAEVVRSERIDLIHSFFARPRGFGGALAKAATGVPLVAGFRGSDVNLLPHLGYGARLDPFFDRALKVLLRMSDWNIYNSRFAERDALAAGARRCGGQVILKGVDLDRFTPTSDKIGARRLIGINPGLPMILAVSGLIPIKGLVDVVRALALVRNAGHAFSFAVCGEGPERAAIEAEAVRVGLGDCTVLPGKMPRADITKYFAAADVFVHGALIEAAGNVLIEAMASGIPVVCTDAGGPAEYVRHGITGFVVPVGDPPAMAARVAELLTDAERRLVLGRQGRRHVEEHLGYARMIKETIDVYRAVLKEGPRPAPE